MQLSMECAKIREDEILQDKTKQQQTAGRVAFRDKQMQLRMTSENLDEIAEKLPTELDLVVELEESFDSTGIQSTGGNKDGQRAASMSETRSQNVIMVNSKDLEHNLVESELDPVEHCITFEHPHSQQSDVCATAVLQMLVEPSETELAKAVKAVESEEVNLPLNSDKNDSMPGINESGVVRSDEVCLQCDATGSGIYEDMPVYRQLMHSGITLTESASSNVDTDISQETELLPVADRIIVPKTDGLDSETKDTAVQNDLPDAMVIRLSPTDDSSDAYTDVLDEDTDRLSEILEKDNLPGPSVYVELQNDLSACTYSSSANNKLTRIDVVEDETNIQPILNAVEETEFGWHS